MLEFIEVGVGMNKIDDMGKEAGVASCSGCGKEVVFCPRCYGVAVVRNGKDGDGRQRFVCRGDGCGKQFTGKPVREMVQLAATKLLRNVAQNLLAVQMSVAVISRCTGLAETTIRFDTRRRRASGQDIK